MHMTGRLSTNAQSHTPAVAVFRRTPRDTRKKVFGRIRYGIVDGNPSAPRPTSKRSDTYIVVVMMINKKLRECRHRAGIPLEVLAFKARVSPRTLWMWERWSCTPRRHAIIQRVAAVLGVKPEELLDENGEEQR